MPDGGSILEVRLRPVRADDWEAVHDWARLDEACRYQPWGPDTPEETRAFVAGAAAAWEQGHRLTYAVEAAGTVIGLGGLQLGAHQQAEISYSVHPRLWGKGFGTVAGGRLLDIGFHEFGLNRIWGTCDPRNTGSARVMRKLGMTFEGRLRQNMLIRDGWRDSDVYGILAAEWEGVIRP